MVLIFVAAPTGGMAQVPCAQSFCGCWTADTLRVNSVVLDENTSIPIEGIRISFASDSTVVGYSDENGSIVSSIPAERSPGCGYGRLSNLLVEDTTLTYETQRLSIA